ncbi:MAG: hypothetical protein ABJO09_00775 [Hyphomicrobiales bacterium]
MASSKITAAILLLFVSIFSADTALAKCRAGTTSADPVHPQGFSASDGWLYPVKKIRDIGFLAALANGAEDGTMRYLQSQSSDTCNHVYIANFTSHGDYVANKFSELVFAAGFFVELCKAYKIDERRLAELTYFFEVLPIIDGYNGVDKANAIQRSQMKVSGAYWMKKRLKTASDCQQLFKERFSHVQIVR